MPTRRAADSTAGEQLFETAVEQFDAAADLIGLSDRTRLILRSPKNEIIVSFPVEMDDQIMLATSKGQSIRVPVDGISFRSRSAGGVRVFNTGADEEVVSVAWIADQGEDDTQE